LLAPSMPTSDPKDLLERLLRESNECEWIEFKANNGDPDMIGRTIAACANAAILKERDRAYIVWGIENKTKKLLGTSIRLSDVKKGAQNIENWLSQVLDPKLMIELLDFEVGGKPFSILVAEPTYDRPVKFDGLEYIRIGENVKKLKDFPEHERSVWLATGRRKFENAIALPHQSEEAILARLETKTYYELRGDEYPTVAAEVIRRFQKIGAISEDMEGGYDITNLGALLFARDITAFPSIATKSVRVIKYSGTDKRKSETEKEGKKGYAVGFVGMLNFIVGQLPKEERYEKGVRKQVDRYSPTAIREFLANALIHQDFTVSGAGPVVEIYSDRIEITNPGNTLIEVDRIIDERKSRNPKFAEAMREMGLCEERGGGVDKAILEVEEMALPTPKFFSSEHAMRVVIFGPKSFKDLSKDDKIWACYCHCVVRWIKHNHMNNTSLRERFSLPDEEYQAVSTVISNAKKAGRIKPADPGQGPRHAKYIPFFA